jgi:hypothetical protein
MEAILASNGRLHNWATTENCAKKLRRAAGELFGEGDDNSARLLRNWSNELQYEADEMRKEYDAEKARIPSWDDLWELLKKQDGWIEDAEKKAT